MGFFFIFEFLIIPGFVAFMILSAKKRRDRQQAEQREAMKRAAEAAHGTGTVAAAKQQTRPAPKQPPRSPYMGSIYGAPAGGIEGPTIAGRVHDAPGATVTAHTNVSGHVVRPANESDHVHTESSITGFTECPPSKRKETAAKAPAPAMRTAASYGSLRFDVGTVRDAVIWSEILGKPKALRRRP